MGRTRFLEKEGERDTHLPSPSAPAAACAVCVCVCVWVCGELVFLAFSKQPFTIDTSLIVPRASPVAEIRVVSTNYLERLHKCVLDTRVFVLRPLMKSVP